MMAKICQRIVYPVAHNSSRRRRGQQEKRQQRRGVAVGKELLDEMFLGVRRRVSFQNIILGASRDRGQKHANGEAELDASFFVT
jgi:hypothetical protein